MRPEDIKAIITAGIPDSYVEVEGDDGTHFTAVIVSSEFDGKSMVQQHQRVYSALGTRMGNEIHALSMQTYTPAEWEKKKSLQIG